MSVLTIPRQDTPDLPNKEEWVTCSQGARILTKRGRSLKQLGKEGKVRTRKIFGSDLRFNLRDILALNESV